MCDRYTVCGVWRRHNTEGGNEYQPVQRGSRVAMWKLAELAAVFVHLLCLCWSHRCPVFTANALFLFLLLFFVLFHVPSRRNSCSLFFSADKRDTIETLTQGAEWSQFALSYVFDNLTEDLKITARKIMLKHRSKAICARLLCAAQLAVDLLTHGNGHTFLFKRPWS